MNFNAPSTSLQLIDMPNPLDTSKADGLCHLSGVVPSNVRGSGTYVFPFTWQLKPQHVKVPHWSEVPSTLPVDNSYVSRLIGFNRSY